MTMFFQCNYQGFAFLQANFFATCEKFEKFIIVLSSKDLSLELLTISTSALDSSTQRLLRWVVRTEKQTVKSV